MHGICDEGAAVDVDVDMQGVMDMVARVDGMIEFDEDELEFLAGK